MRKLLTATVAGAALALAASAASAAVNFQGSYSVTLNTTDPGLVVAASPNPGNFNFNMGDAPSTLNNQSLFKLYTNEASVNPDDWNGKSITVNFTFTAPAAGSGSVGGVTYGTSDWTGFFQNGVVTWSGDETVDFGSYGTLNIHLDDAVYNEGWFWSLDKGKKNGTFITADFALSPSAVPEPGTWALMITGFGLAGAALRRQRKLVLAA